MMIYTVLSKATYVALYDVHYPEEDELDSVPVIEDHLCYVQVPAESYMEAVNRLINEGVIDNVFGIGDIGAIAGTRRIAPYANEVSLQTSIEQVQSHLGYVDPLEPFTLQDTQPVIPVVCGYDLER